MLREYGLAAAATLLCTPESLRILVHQTRHRIEKEPVRPRHLKTEPAVGYRLEPPDE